MDGAPAARRGASPRFHVIAGLGLGLAVVGIVLGSRGFTSPGSGAAARPAVPSSGSVQVPAVREHLATSRGSPVAHDNEVMALAPQSGRLFAATDQWEYPGPAAHGQVLVKRSGASPWTVFERTQSLRVQALDSFPIPRDQWRGGGHSLLVTQAIVHGRSRVQWLLDRGGSFALSDSYALPTTAAAVRSFGAHESGGVWAVYAGVEPTGILRGTWSPAKHTLVFDPKPELVAAPPGSPGLKTQKVTAFADCGGALYVTINTRLFRRNDGSLPAGVPRWVLVYQERPVGAFNSGLRGLTCVTHRGSPALVASTEGDGDVYRFDHLPDGRLDGAPAPGTRGRLTPTLEFSPVPAIRSMLAAQGTTLPATGRGSIVYVIAAYNNFEPLNVAGAVDHAFGFEWGYQGACPPTRHCGPRALGATVFDAAACFGVREDLGREPTYGLQCLSGPDFRPTPTTSPIRAGQAFVSIRTIAPSPFGDGRVYFGGYDCNFFPADGTAWIATSSSRSIRRPQRGSAVGAEG